MIVALTVIAWFICAGIGYGVGMHVDHDEIESGPIFWMFMFALLWPMFLLMGIGYIVLKQLSKIGMFFAGFLDKALERKEDEDE